MPHICTRISTVYLCAEILAADLSVVEKERRRLEIADWLPLELDLQIILSDALHTQSARPLPLLTRSRWVPPSSSARSKRAKPRDILLTATARCSLRVSRCTSMRASRILPELLRTGRFARRDRCEERGRRVRGKGMDVRVQGRSARSILYGGARVAGD